MLSVKGVGEPCAGKSHARFDGGELETGSVERWSPEMGAYGKLWG